MTAPVMLCERSTTSAGVRWTFLCPHCQVWHTHSAAGGRRSAHCTAGSPYLASGYVLRLAPGQKGQRREPAPPWYSLLIAAAEGRRYAVGLSMEAMDRLTGGAERSYAKLVHPDSESGRLASPATLQRVISALFPHGLAITLTPVEPGSKAEGRGVENSEGSRLLIKREAQFWHRGSRLQHMRELGRRGGKARLVKISKERRQQIAREAARARWHPVPSVDSRGGAVAGNFARPMSVS